MGNDRKYIGSGQTASPIKEIVSGKRLLCRQLFHIWAFAAQEGLWDEAVSFTQENWSIPAPFEECFDWLPLHSGYAGPEMEVPGHAREETPDP